MIEEIKVSPERFRCVFVVFLYVTKVSPASIKHRKPQNSRTKKYISFKSALLMLKVSTNAFHSTNLFRCFSRYQVPTNRVAPSFCIQTTHNPHFLNWLRRRVNARNVSFRISLRWPIHIICSPVDKSKLSFDKNSQVNNLI